MAVIDMEKEYLRQYLNAGGKDALAETAEFMGSRKIQVIDWLNKGKIRGEDLIRLRYFLEKKRFEITEFSELTSDIYELGKLIAYRRIALKAVASELGYPTDELLRKLRGKRNFVKSGRDALSKILERFGIRVDRNNGENPSEDSQLSREERKVSVEKLAKRINEISPLAEKVDSDDFTKVDRNYLRALTGGDGIFKLSNTLNHLCGERARIMHKNRKETE